MNSHDTNSIAMFGALAGMFMTLFLIILVLAVFFIICRWKIFTKAGKPGWAAIVPIYNYIVTLEIVGKPAWWILLLLIPLVNIVIAIMVLNELSKRFGQGIGFTLGLLFLPVIFYPVLAFGNYQYTPPGLETAV